MWKKVIYIFSLLLAFLLVYTAVVSRDGHGFLYKYFNDEVKVVSHYTDEDGNVRINTTSLAEDVSGFAGTTPLEVTVTPEGVIGHIEVLENNETKGFMRRARTILDGYSGKTVEEASAYDPDAVTGATYTSVALKKNMAAAMEFYTGTVTAPKFRFNPGISDIAVLLVIISGILIPVFFKNRYMRMLQLAMNVAVLGFWGHTFLSFGSMMGWAASGVDLMTVSLPFLLLVIVAVMPLFGRSEHYCTWYCPMGSAQELLGRVVPAKYKIRLPRKASRIMNIVRELLFLTLLILMWTGVWIGWIDYEAFGFFMLEEAGWVVILIASLFLFLSLFINRPYCRMICPTGTLLKISQGKISSFRK